MKIQIPKFTIPKPTKTAVGVVTGLAITTFGCWSAGYDFDGRGLDLLFVECVIAFGGFIGFFVARGDLN